MSDLELNTQIFRCRKHGVVPDPDCLTCSMAKAENAHIGALLLKDDKDKEAE